MKRSKIYLFGAVASILCAVLFTLIPTENQNQKQKPVYIYDSNDNISLSDVDESLNPLDDVDYKLETVHGSLPENDTVEYRIDHNTLNFFKRLEQLFPETRDLSEHLEAVRKFLFEEYPETEAEKLLEVYSSYLACELELEDNIDFSALGSSDPMDAIDVLAGIQAFRRARMGSDLADSLFGPKAKASEYSIRKAAVLEDDSLYGIEKEEALRTLNEDMWGSEAGDVIKNVSPYGQYREKLKIYRRDLEEIGSDEEYKRLMRNFREEFFEPDAIDRLEMLEKKREEEKERESLYDQRKRAIMDSRDMDEELKAEEIEALQDEMFGEDADTFRARLSLRTPGSR